MSTYKIFDNTFRIWYNEITIKQRPKTQGGKVMSKKKDYWYVLVLSNEGPVFVTGTGEHHTAFWNKDEKPMEMDESYAKNMALGLLVNFHQGFAVCSPVELNNQPYFYDKGEWKWEWFKKEEKKNDTER